MGRIFIAFLFIIIPFVKLFADTDANACDIDSPCSCFTTSSACSSAPGCEWGGENNPICKACYRGSDEESGNFGPRCESDCNDPSVGAGPDFQFGHQHIDDQNNAIRGARNKYECYKKLDTADSGTPQGGHGYRCKDPDDQMVNTECREYYRDNDAGATDTDTDLAYQGDANYHFVTCDASNVGLLNEDYSGYHMESNNQKCYSNRRNCSKFTISTGDQNQCITSDSSHQNRTIYSDAVLTWGTDTQKWQANSSCKCRVEGDFSDQNCNGFKEFSNTGMVDSSTVFAQLIFRNNSSYGATTHCSGCFAGYYASEANSGSFNCVPALQGYYSTGCGTKWTDGEPCYSGPNPINCEGYESILKPCYAGMTSNSGATSVQDCRYTDQTQFCDAWGCTSYSDLVGSNSDWWWYMQSGTTTGDQY